MSHTPEPIVNARLSAGPLSRRHLLKLAGTTAAVAACASLGVMSPTATAQAPKNSGVLRFRMVATVGLAQLKSGAPTTVWRFRHTLLEGDESWLAKGPSYLGPTIRVPRGTRVICEFVNQLDEPSIIHWHGLDIPASQDGHPADAVPAGGTKLYDFIVDQPAGTYWYHPHPDMRTAVQVYMGLAGLFIVTDKIEQKAGLPEGACDLPMVIQDRKFDTGNQLVYGDPSGVVGMLGDAILVNGQINPTIACSSRGYRLRVLNGSNSRIYKLSLSDGSPITVVGTDGGLLEAPVTRPYLMLAPGQRAELYLDLKTKSVGDIVTLKSLYFAPVMQGVPPLVNGAAFDICRFEVTRAYADSSTLPATLNPRYTRYNVADAANAASPRMFPISYSAPSQGRCEPCWMLNGGVYELTTVAANENVPADTLEVIQIENPGTGVAMPHPIHFHGRPFQVLSRERVSGSAGVYNTVKDGYQDEGWQDTVILWPGERVKLLMKWTKHRGLFVYHCHNLEHEDMGMMRNLRVV